MDRILIKGLASESRGVEVVLGEEVVEAVVASEIDGAGSESGGARDDDGEVEEAEVCTGVLLLSSLGLCITVTREAAALT